MFQIENLQRIRINSYSKTKLFDRNMKNLVRTIYKINFCVPDDVFDKWIEKTYTWGIPYD